MMDYFLSWCIDEAAIPKIRNKNTCFGFCLPQTYVFSAEKLLFSAVEQMFDSSLLDKSNKCSEHLF